MNINCNKNIEIFNIDHMGRGIGKISEKIVFVPNTLINEVVNIEIINSKKNYSEGEVINFIKTSSDRVNSDCPYFLKCGGCDLLHMTYDKQLEFKENKVKELVKKIAKIDVDIKPIVKCDNQFFYRNKATFQVKKKIGFYKKKSYDIVEIDKCIISDEKINEILSLIKKNINLDNINTIIIRASKNIDETMVIFEIDGIINEKLVINVLKDYTNSIIKKKDGKYETLYGTSFITEVLGKNKFIISPDSFFQVNTNQANNLYNKILDYCEVNGEKNILDLYCGTGTIGLFLAEKARKVIGIELNKYAVMDANENKKINNSNNVEFLCGDAGKLIRNSKIKPDIIIIDPPRIGLGKNTIDEIVKLDAEKIIYVSCDPATLSRDLYVLKDKYNIIEITPFDMFPNTYHVETVVLMSKKEKGIDNVKEI